MARNRSVFSARLIIGLAIISLGVLFTLDNLGWVDPAPILRFWPLLLLLIALAKLLHGRFFAALAWAAFGVLFLLRSLEVIGFDPLELWPLVLVIIGFNLVRRAVFPGASRSDGGEQDSLSGFAMFTGQKYRSASQNFLSGDFTAIMGGCNVDLRSADLAPGAVIDVFTFWGGIDIAVPTDWTVEPSIAILAGGLDDRTDPDRADPNKRLLVRGTCLMGGVRLKN